MIRFISHSPQLTQWAKTDTKESHFKSHKYTNFALRDRFIFFVIEEEKKNPEFMRFLNIGMLFATYLKLAGEVSLASFAFMKREDSLCHTV